MTRVQGDKGTNCAAINVETQAPPLPNIATVSQ
jgi:hypothetical protein